MDALENEGLVYQGKKSWKRVILEEKGIERAKLLLEKYGIEDWHESQRKVILYLYERGKYIFIH